MQSVQDPHLKYICAAAIPPQSRIHWFATVYFGHVVTRSLHQAERFIVNGSTAWLWHPSFTRPRTYVVPIFVWSDTTTMHLKRVKRAKPFRKSIRISEMRNFALRWLCFRYPTNLHWFAIYPISKLLTEQQHLRNLTRYSAYRCRLWVRWPIFYRVHPGTQMLALRSGIRLETEALLM